MMMAGCPDQPAAGPARLSFAGQEIIVAVPKGWDFPTAWELPIQEWSAQTHATCTLREYDPAAALASPQTLIANGDDLILLPLNRLGDIAAGDALAEIPQALRAEANLNWLDLFQGLREQIASRGRRPLVVPAAAPVLVVYFREDLLKLANLSPPRTWADYDLLVTSLDRWAPGLTVAEPWGEPFRATMFLARALPFVKHPSQYSVFWDIESGEPLIDNAGFVRSLEESRRAISRMPAEVLGYDPADCRREILAGRAAIAIGYESGPKAAGIAFAPALGSDTIAEFERAANVHIGVCRLPGATEAFHQSNQRWETIPGGDVNYVPLCGFGGLCAAVSARSSPSEQEAAWHLLNTLIGETLSSAFPAATRTPCRESHVAQPAGWTGDELHDAERYKYLNAVSQSLRDTRLVAELPVPGHAEFRRALTEGLTSALSGQAGPEPALKAVAARWRTIADRHGGASKVRDAYRVSLGLTAND
jgi:ABC-type glycerol-3-phosphate transport system substrate-binding protein